MKNWIKHIFAGSGVEEQPRQAATLKDAFAAKYPDNTNIPAMFEAATQCACTWENLTKARLQAFVDYMAERLAPNSVHQYATKFKAVLNLYADEVLLPRDYAKVLTPRKCTSTAVYLTEEELTLIEQYSPRNAKERYVRAIFLISAYTGARHSDAVRMNASNIIDGKLQYVSIKTKTPATLPLKPVVAKCITEMDSIEMTDKTFNANIRRICRACGITSHVKVFKAGEESEGEKCDFVGSHTARRSFASNLYLRGVDIYTISRLLGHHDVKTTQQYIQAGVRIDSKELMEYFQ